MSIEELPSRSMMAFRHPGDEWDGYAALIVAAYVDHTLSTVKEHNDKTRTEEQAESFPDAMHILRDWKTEKKRGAYIPPTP